MTREDKVNTTTELIRKRNRELDLAHYALTAESRKKHREEVNRLNREIKRRVRQEVGNGGQREF